MSDVTPMQPEKLNDDDVNNIDGGIAPTPTYQDPIEPVNPPVYITLAIGEGGGDLPNLM